MAPEQGSETQRTAAGLACFDSAAKRRAYRPGAHSLVRKTGTDRIWEHRHAYSALSPCLGAKARYAATTGKQKTRLLCLLQLKTGQSHANFKERVDHRHR